MRAADGESPDPSAYRHGGPEVAHTSLVAWDGEQAVGLVMGYRRPTRPDTLVVRQISVSPPYRRRGIGRAMLVRLRQQLSCAGVWWVEARLPASSHASRRLFQSFAIAARARYAELDLPPDRSFPPPFEGQILVRVGGDPSLIGHQRRPAGASHRDLASMLLLECGQVVGDRPGIGAIVTQADEPIGANG